MLTKAELKIIDGGADIRDNPARPGDKAFAPRALAITTFPHQQPKGNSEAWTRHNGRVTLTVRPGWDHDAVLRQARNVLTEEISFHLDEQYSPPAVAWPA